MRIDLADQAVPKACTNLCARIHYIPQTTAGAKGEMPGLHWSMFLSEWNRTGVGMNRRHGGTPEQLRVALPRRVQRRGSIDYFNASILQLLPLIPISKQKALRHTSNILSSLFKSYQSTSIHSQPWLWPPKLIGNMKGISAAWVPFTDISAGSEFSSFSLHQSFYSSPASRHRYGIRSDC